MEPALRQGVDAGAAADVAAQVGFLPGAAAVGEVFAVHVDAVEGVRRGALDHAVNLVELHLGGVERGFGGQPRQLLGRLQGAVDELGHACPDHGYSSHSHGFCSELKIATAPLVVGTPRHDCAKPILAPGSCRGPAWPRSCSTNSTMR